MSTFHRSILFLRFEEVVWPGGMSNIPPVLDEAVIEAVERVAQRFGISLDGSAKNSEAIQVAVEDSLIPMQYFLDRSTSAHHFARVAEKEGRYFAAISGEIFRDPEFEEDDLAALEALAVYQLSALANAHQKEKLDLVLAISADLFELNLKIGQKQISKEISKMASQKAKKRHQGMNALKAEILADWQEHKLEYESRSDYARIMGELKGIKYRTLYEWLAAYDRQHQEIHDQL